jgi:phosphatidylinositol alpha 1,6-mannosyltransferase
MDNWQPMTPDKLKIALFSGNYNYVRDGANQALNRLVDFLLRQGASVRVYSPTSPQPAFEPAGDLVSVKSTSFPFGRDEYPLALGMPRETRQNLASFNPNIVHVSAPDILGHRAMSWAKARSVPVLASMHTRFETYLHYYRMGFAEPLLRAVMRRFYRRASAVVAPSESMAELMREQRMSDYISIWARGIDTNIFHPGRRSYDWRRGHGIGDTEPVIGFLGRLVMEKGLDVFCDTVDILTKRKVPHKILIIGDGPAKGWFAERLPHAVFAGFQAGDELGRAVASMDILFNPSVTETFGNVTLEAMACGVPVVAAHATGSKNLVANGGTGRLIAPGDTEGFAAALADYCGDERLRSAHGKGGEEASKSYDWDRVNQAVLDTYLRISRPISA